MEIFLFFSVPFFILIEVAGWMKSTGPPAVTWFVIPDLLWHLCAASSSILFGFFVGMMAKKTRKKIGLGWNEL